MWEQNWKNKRFFCNFCYTCCSKKKQTPTIDAVQIHGAEPLEKEETETVWEKFFGGPFARLVRKLRWPIVIIVSAWGVASIVFGTKIKKLAETETFFPDDHWIITTFYLALKNFHDGSLNKQVLVDIMLGVDKLDRTGLSYWDGVNFGEIVWDKDFDVSPVENQEYLLNFC